MTVEEIKIKISAEAGSLKTEIDSVNKALAEMKNLAQNAASAAAAAVSAKTAFGITEGGFSDTGDSALVNSSAGGLKTAPYRQTAAVPDISGKDTLIGAVSSGEKESSQPIQINTTVELDGDSIGKAAASFNLRRNRITNGFSREGV
ncbi:MAG: hypothetical protein ACI4KO_07895 [Ruminiclostridium sp.]